MRRALPSALAAAALASLSLVALLQVRAVAQVPNPDETPASSFMPLATPSPQVGPPMAVDDVIADAREYDAKPVQATGTVQNLRTDTTPRGTILQFDLCGHHCVHVLDADNPSLTENETATVRGTFYRHLSRGRFSQDDMLIVIAGGLPPDRNFNWRRQLEGYPPTTPSPT